MRLHRLDQVEKIAGSKYTAVVAIAKRAMEANKRFITMHASRRNPVAWAMQEILEGKLDIIPGQEVPEGAGGVMGEAAAELLRAGRFIHQEDIALEAEEIGLEREIARAVGAEKEAGKEEERDAEEREEGGEEEEKAEEEEKVEEEEASEEAEPEEAEETEPGQW